MAYFDDPENRKNWERELRQMKVEKARRAGGYEGSVKREGESYRRAVTFEELMVMEGIGTGNIVSKKSMEKKLEKQTQMEGRSL
ncbi:MAG: hypothetical protein LUG90_01730 [Clostridiaceae bacterium]|nr:hypothetical protein [Clostridiaceae bacterium]